jgi:hypothetical protein
MGGMSMASTCFRILASALLASAGLRAEPAVIGLARAYLGPDSTLDGIRSIHFVGTLDRVDPDHPEVGTLHTSLDMIFSKPWQQRQVVRASKVTETTVLDGYDAWDRLQDNADATKFRLRWLSAAEIKSLRANTWENLHFFRGLEEGATIDDKGPATTDGVACERVDFIHGPGNVFERYFDRDTGRLVLSVRNGETIRESGEIMVNGVRFPKSIVSVIKTASGKDLVSTVTFDSIALNEPLAPDLFAAPSMGSATVRGTETIAPGK